MVLLVSGFDPSGGAGMLQDVKILSLLGVSAMGVVSAHTVQNSSKVFSVKFRSWSDLEQELSALPKPKFVKIGLISPDHVELLRKTYPNAFLVWNIVLESSSGFKFQREEDVLRNLDSANLVVLNSEEASRLGLTEDERTIVTGGHSNGEKIKVWYNGKEFETERVFGEFHGTGCAFTSALVGYLSFGYSIEEAIRASMELLVKILKVSEKQVQSEKLARDWMKFDAFQELEKIMPWLEELGPKTIPEVGQNVSYALPWSQNEFEVAKFPGRIRLKEGRPTFVSCPSFRDVSHTARMVLTAKRFCPHVRCVTNVRYRREYIDRALERGLKVYKLDRSLEPAELKELEKGSMEWMVKKVYEDLGEIPDIVYDEGFFGKEAMIRVFGRNPVEVIQKVRKIVE
ncbi:thiamine-phosphate synthase family protein [Pseudothermotoga sp.]